MRTIGLLAVLALPLAAQDAAVFDSVVDAETNALWRGANVVPADRADDFEFLRRVTLDLAGRPPALEEVQAWRADTSAGKRERRIDALLASPAFLDFWSRRLSASLLGSGDAMLNQAGVSESFVVWMRKRLQGRAAWDAIVSDILAASTASAGTRTETAFLAQFLRYENGAVVFRADEAAGKVASVMLGLRLRCAQCHDHPHDRWTMEDFHGLVAFFDGTYPNARRPEAAGRKGIASKPVFLGERPRAEARRDLGRLVTSHEQFSRAFVNRVWAYLFGRGIVHPYDDFNPQRRAPAMAVLDALAREWRVKKFDLRWLLRTIVMSRAYQRTSRGPADTAPAQLDAFARSRVRPLTPEQQWAAIAQATQLERATIDPASLAAAGLPPNASRDYTVEMMKRWFLALVAKGSQPDTPEALQTYTGNHQVLLALMNADAPVWAGVRIASGGRLSRLLRANADGTVILNELYQASLGRLPTAREREKLLLVAYDRGKERGFEQIFWILLNSDEFIFNH